jgi:hypothetical protein
MINILVIVVLLSAVATAFHVRIAPKQLMKTTSVSMMAAEAVPTIDTTKPARTFIDCTRQAAICARKALDDGEKLIEVEFPPLPLDFLEDSASSARDIADANTRWAVEFAKSFTDLGKVTIIYPDEAELDSAVQYVDEPGGRDPYTNVSLATIRTDSIRNAQTLDQIIMSVFGATVGGTVEAIKDTAVYVALVSSTQELPDLEKLHKLDPSIPIVFFNLRLDILRGDLGLPLFPGRDLHWRFLTRIRPAYLMRSRSFATSLRKPPFIINYSGVLFRAYPEKFQSILNTGDGKSKTVMTEDERPTNAGFREGLTDALRVSGVTDGELKVAQNLVWWEKEMEKEESAKWRQ